jgi:hypothetical protein
MRAWCRPSGVIGFSRYTPEGALPIARSRSEKRLRAFIEVHARHGWKKGKLLVPGIPEAKDQVAGLEALEAFVTWCAKCAKPEDKIIVLTRAHRRPIDGKARA